MRNIGNNNFIICVGDDIRYRFAQELMPDGQIIDTNSFKISKNYIFIHSNEENVISDGKKIMVYTSKIPDGRILEFPVSGIDVKTILTDQNKVKIGKVLIFADFPYNKEDLHYLVDKMCRKAGSAGINVILYNEKRRAGYTDIQKSDEILKQAYNEFGVFNIKIYEYFLNSDKTEIFRAVPDNVRFFKSKYSKELKSSQYRIDNRFDIHYKTFLERTYEHYFSFNNPDEFARFVKLFEFGNIDKKAEDIWLIFENDFKNMYLDLNSDIMNEISDFYLDYISEIMSFRLEQEEMIIKKSAIDLFNRSFANHVKISCSKTELEYKEVLNKNNIITEFTKRIEDYFYIQLKQMLYQAADSKLKIINKIIYADSEKEK